MRRAAAPDSLLAGSSASADSIADVNSSLALSLFRRRFWRREKKLLLDADLVG